MADPAHTPPRRERGASYTAPLSRHLICRDWAPDPGDFRCFLLAGSKRLDIEFAAAGPEKAFSVSEAGHIGDACLHSHSRETRPLLQHACEVFVAWVRIDDQVPTHPKILRAGPAASWLWLSSIAYCQAHLTDGKLPREALASLLPGCSYHVASALAKKLLAVKLWHCSPSGYEVHDYLDYNASRQQALAKKGFLKEARSISGRKGAASRWKNHGKSIANTPHFENGKPMAPSHPIPLNTGTGNPEVPDRADISAKVKAHAATTAAGGNGSDNGSGQNKRPIFKGARLVVFEWQRDDLKKLLGPRLQNFDLAGWFGQLDGELSLSDELVPQRDHGRWLQQQLLDELKRRGIPQHGTGPPLTVDELKLVNKWRVERGERPLP